MLKNNGILIQFIDKEFYTAKHFAYDGVCAFSSDYLHFCDEAGSLVRPISDRWIMIDGPMTVFESVNAKALIGLCCKHNANIRILVIETESAEPMWDGCDFPKTHLGYEVVTDTLDDPVFCSLLDEESVYIKFKDSLNSHGLFTTYKSAQDFLNYISEVEKEEIEECGLSSCRVASVSIADYITERNK